MKLTVHTERGTFTSKQQDRVTEDQAATLKDLLKNVSADGNHFILDTDSGYVVLGRGLLLTAAFVVDS